MRRGTKVGVAVISVALALALPAAASAQDYTVSVVEPQNEWDPDFIEADSGQEVRWRFRTPAGDPVTVPHDIQLFAGDEPTGERLVDSGFHFPNNPSSPQYADYTFDDEGTFTYVCSIHLNTMRGTVQVGDPIPPGNPKLGLGVKPKRARGKVGRTKSFRAILRNTGDAMMNDAMVCAQAPKRLVRIQKGRCASFASLDAGATRKPKFLFKPTRKARGRKVKIKFVAVGTDPADQSSLARRTAKATLKVRR